MQEYILKTKRSKFFHCLLVTLKFLAKLFFKIFFRLEVKGYEKIPAKGRLILCCNHISYADPVIISACFPRIIFFMAKVEIFKYRPIKAFFKYFNAFPVNRNKYDRIALRNALLVLENDGVLGIFPEGTRSAEGIIREGQKGVGLISLLGKSQILPAAISGTNKIVQKPHKRFYFPKIKLIFGDLIDLNTKDINNRNEAINYITEKTMDSIKSLYNKIK